MANANDIKIPYILSVFSSNAPPDFNIISQRKKVTYIADIVCKAGFGLLANVFIAQLYNFSSVKVDGLHVIQLIIYKLELKKTQNLLQKDKKLHLYIAKYVHDLVNKKILSIRKFNSFDLKVLIYFLKIFLHSFFVI